MKLTINNLSIPSLILISTIVLISSATYSADYSAESTVASADILRRSILENNLLLLQSLVRDFKAGRTDPFFCFRGTMADFGPDMSTRPSDPLEYARAYAPSLVLTLVAARTEADEDARAAILASRNRSSANPQEATR